MEKACLVSSRAKSPRRPPASGLARYLTVERVIIGGAVGFTIVFLAVLVLGSIFNAPPGLDLAAIPDSSQSFPIQSRDHIEPGAQHPPYNSDPPTGGWHYALAARTGVYTGALPDEQVVHNLEHGHIWLSYRDAGDEEALAVLRDLQRLYPDYVIVTHRPQNDTRIAAAAWGRLLALNEPDAGQLHAFIVRYRERAPENIPG